ncbi:MAG TPA: hypothetical protein VGD79_03590 [Thermoanaerobaculia bacterium]|jgi:hypothetical protein
MQTILLAALLSFHVTLTDGRTALQANPKFDELKLSEAQLQDAAKGRVLMLDRTSGAKWNWLVLSWLDNKPAPEHGLNESGVGVVGKTADVSLTPIDDQTFAVRCLHDDCAVTSSRDGKAEKAALKRGESQQVPFDSDVRVTF